MHSKTQIRDLTRKFNLRTPVGKKNQIEQSNEDQTAKETKLKRRKKQASFTKPDLSQILQKQKLVWVDYSERGFRDETLGA